MSEDLKDKFFAPSTNAGVAKKTHAELSHTVRKTDEVLSVQSIAAGEGSEIRDNTQITNLHLADLDFYFFMKLKNLDGSKIIEDADIEAGKVYSVSLSVSLVPSKKTGLIQTPMKIKKQLDLSFMGNDFEILDNRIISFQVADYQTWREEFQIKVREGSKGLGSLRLDFKEGQADFMPYASRLEVNVFSLAASITPPKTVSLTANIANAENAVILYVNPNGQKEWSIQGISPHESINQTIKAPNIPVNIWDYAKKSLGSLLKWLRETITYFQNQCNLAIVDLTSQQISWERIELKTNVYLGVEAKVVRWVEQEARGEKILLDLAQPRIYQGRLVDYKHPRDLNCDDIDTALNSWRQSLGKHKQQPVAIGLLNCHHRLTEISFETVARKVDDYSLFLFANCPYSACVIWEDERPSGIAATALSEVASGYLGTIGEIDTGFAEQLQAKFLELARQKDGVKPVDFLRSLRFTYAKMLLSDDDLKIERAERLLPYAFSYVYYGNPNDVVKITGGGQS